MSFRTVIFSSGYAESSKISFLIFSTLFSGRGQTFETKADAVKSLAHDLWNKFCSEHEGLDEDFFIDSDFHDMIYSFHGSDTNDYGEAEWCSHTDLSYIWSPFWPANVRGEIEAGKAVYIWENAETIFSRILKEKYPNFFTWEEPFKTGELEELIDSNWR